MAKLGLRLHVGQGTAHGPLTVFPVWTDAPTAAPRYLTSTGAPVDVAERSGSPAVDQLVVTNRADRPVLLLAGELLEGGWQTRALTTTTLLAPDRPTVARVVCVEQGRWHGGQTHARRGRRAPATVLRVLGREDAQQGVWEQVRGYEQVAGPSATDSLAERLNSIQLATQRLTQGLRPLAGQRGVLVGVAGRPTWLEIFDTRRSLVAHWPGLMQAATMDALGRPAVRTPGALARSFAERVERTPMVLSGSSGLGVRLRGSDPRVRSDALHWDDRTIHLTAIASEV
ncbi:ARPP-1 family domain-containing protein [Geodermatophilus sp. FMUSA9-8]|uniref:ARPP-1 family domain-containing protein n=1 Tax=Geodermatophilus sp. FMUSA9-8 TaxID=3120155 RepID=UPI003008D9A7